MVKKSTLIYTMFAAVGLLCLHTSTVIDPSNPPTGKTGGPGEQTCNTSGCHNGGTYTGTVSIAGVPDTVLPNTDYTITLTNTSNASRAGFQLICLDDTNVKAGTLTAGTGGNVTTANNGRQYVRQSTPKVLTSGSASWSFNWKSPSAAAGDKMTFYFSSLCSNGNGEKTGDNTLVANKAVIFAPVVSAVNTLDANMVKVYPNPVVNEVAVELPADAKATVSLSNANGQMIATKNTEGKTTFDMNNLAKGIYTIQVRIGEKSLTKKVVKE